MNTEDIKNIKAIINNLDINSEEDRKTFEQNYLYPALKTIYSGVLGKITPIIVGSVSLYLQGLYLDKFPGDIDIRFQNCKNTQFYNLLYSRMCLKYGFNIEFLNYMNNDTLDEIKILNVDNIIIHTAKIEETLVFYNHYRDLWAYKGNTRKSRKYINKLNFIKNNYPQYFTENAET